MEFVSKDKCIKLIRQQEFNNSLTREKMSPLLLACRDGLLDIVIELINNGADLYHVDKMGNNALHHASYEGHIKIVEWLLAKGIFDINVKNNKGNTALHLAAWEFHTKIVECLINNGANKFLINNKEQLPFDLALKIVSCGDIISLLNPYVWLNAIFESFC